MPLGLPGAPWRLSHLCSALTSYLALASDCAFPPVHGVESQPSARLKLVGQCNRPPTAMSLAPHTTMKLTAPASSGRQGFYPKAFPGAILVIAFWDQGKDSAFPYLFGAAFLRTANVSFTHLSLIFFHSDQVSPTQKAQLWRHLSAKVFYQEVCFWRPVCFCM